VNYPEVLNYLDKLGNEILTMKFGLDTTRAILRKLGNPQRTYPSVIVAGTNGKGSTSSFIHQGLTASGLNSGIFTSPHLERIEERVRINNRNISEEEFARSFTRVLDAALSLDPTVHPTFFELITCTALYCFASFEIDAAVLEVGMGGRLDSTNAVDPVLSVITSIGLDHQQYLGETLSLIAAEKAGILRHGVPALSAPQKEEVSETLKKKAGESGADLRFVRKDDFRITGCREGGCSFYYHGEGYQLGVQGEHQVENAVLAMEALAILAEKGWPLQKKGIKKGISGMRRPGVLEVIAGNPEIILDGGHNLDAAGKLKRFLEAHRTRPLTLMLGMMKDKDVRAVASLLAPLFDRIFLVPINSARAIDPADLKTHVPQGIAAADAVEALETAVKLGNPVVVTGSFYLAGEIRRILNSGKIPGYSPDLGFEPDCTAGD